MLRPWIKGKNRNQEAPYNFGYDLLGITIAHTDDRSALVIEPWMTTSFFLWLSATRISFDLGRAQIFQRLHRLTLLPTESACSLRTQNHCTFPFRFSCKPGSHRSGELLQGAFECTTNSCSSVPFAFANSLVRLSDLFRMSRVSPLTSESSR